MVICILLLKINNINTGSNDIIISAVNVHPYEFDKWCMDKVLIGYKFHQFLINRTLLIDQSDEKKIISVKFYSMVLIEIHLIMEIVELVRYYLLMMIK